tara:strand:+ start:107 stop:670 length:564 start_codon:yes stop_codon:yes gene_type:complete
MPNYQLSKIYKITSSQTDKCYIGSSCEKYLSARIAKHNNHYKRYCNGKMNYITSFEIIQFKDAKIELLELCPCNIKEELNVCEGKWIKQLDCVNKNIAGRTSKQYTYDTKDKKKEYDIINKDKNNEYNKKWRNDNQNIISKKSKKRYENKKDELKLKMECECGSIIRITNLPRHKKSQKHLKYLETI